MKKQTDFHSKSSSGDDHINTPDNMSKVFFSGNVYRVLDNVPEILCEWWSNSKKDMSSFLKDEGLSEIINEDTFTDILLGKYYFTEHFLLLISKKIPSKITLQRLYTLNKRYAQRRPQATQLKINKNLIYYLLKKRKAENKKEKQIRKSQKRLQNIEQNLILERKYSKKYRETHRDEINERQRKHYQENLLELREKNREKQKKIPGTTS